MVMNFLFQLNKKTIGLVRSIFETNTEFRDSVFYDASSWSIANFYDIDYSHQLREMNWKSS